MKRYRLGYPKFQATRDATEQILSGLSPDEWRPAVDVSKLLGISVNRTMWLLNSLSTSLVERKEERKPFSKSGTRSIWRLKTAA